MLSQDTFRNAALNGALALLNGGSLRLREGETTRVTFALKSPACAAAQEGAAPLDVESPAMDAVADSSAEDELDNFQFLTSGAEVQCGGTITDNDGAGEMKMNHPDVEQGDELTVEDWTFFIPAEPAP